MKFEIKKAVRTAKKSKIALNGVSGSGKTFTALALAQGLKNGGRICVIDSENNSSTLYSDQFDFDVLNLTEPTVQNYLSAIREVEKTGYDVLIIDSLSHAWQDLLEEVDRVQLRDKRKNSFTAWADVTPIYNQLVQAVVNADLHCICTFRAKSEYTMEEYTDSRGQKRTRPVKLGLAPIFRTGGEYEFDVVANIDIEHNFVIEKTRYQFLDGLVQAKPDQELGAKIKTWLASGATPEKPKKQEYLYDFSNLEQEKFDWLLNSKLLANGKEVEPRIYALPHKLGNEKFTQFLVDSSN
jgi:hypothetical protein